MSQKATQWAWEQDLPPTGKLVLLALADAVNGGYRACWGCCPGQARLASACGISERQVIKHLQGLKERGLIEITARAGEGQGRKSNAYRLCPEQHVLDLEPPSEDPREGEKKGTQKFTLPGGQSEHVFTLPRGGKVNFLSGNVNPSSLCTPYRQEEEDRERVLVSVDTTHTREVLSPKTLSQDPGPVTVGMEPDIEADLAPWSPPHALGQTASDQAPAFDWAQMAADIRPDIQADIVWAKFQAHLAIKQPGRQPTADEWRLWLLREWKNNSGAAMITGRHRALGGFATRQGPPTERTVHEVRHEN